MRADCAALSVTRRLGGTTAPASETQGCSPAQSGSNPMRFVVRLCAMGKQENSLELAQGKAVAREWSVA